MIDPASLGTLVIGLNHVRLEQDGPMRSQRRPPGDRRVGLRVRAARGLRTLADRLERPAVRRSPA